MSTKTLFKVVYEHTDRNGETYEHVGSVFFRNYDWAVEMGRETALDISNSIYTVSVKYIIAVPAPGDQTLTL